MEQRQHHAAPATSLSYFPGASAVRTRSNEITSQLDNFDFIIRSGRAVMLPLYKGTSERGDGTKRTFPNTTSSYRDHVIVWSKDLGRTIDYLETRPDIAHDKLAFDGYSWGAAMGALLPAVDERLQALVLVSPGFYLKKCLPEVDRLNYAPRMKTAVLVLNGRFDFIFPTGNSQEAMLRMLGTPNEDKHRVIYETGHDIPRIELIEETLNWLDWYLGPVK